MFIIKTLLDLNLNRNHELYLLLTESQDMSRPPFSLKLSIITGALWGPTALIKSLSIPFQTLISPFSHPVTRIVFSGCQANAVTW